MEVTKNPLDALSIVDGSYSITTATEWHAATAADEMTYLSTFGVTISVMKGKNYNNYDPNKAVSATNVIPVEEDVLSLFADNAILADGTHKLPRGWKITRIQTSAGKAILYR